MGLHDPAHPDATARRLLHDLTHARCNHEPAGSIDDDWDHEREACEGAHDLAEVERLRWRAATNLTVARAALDALQDVAGQHGWTHERFAAALEGSGDDAADMELLLDFDRTALRRSWSIGHGEGEYGLRWAIPQDRGSARRLRAALECVMQGGVVPRWTTATHGSSHHVAFIDLAGADGLETAIAAANHALIERYPDQSEWACWRRYTKHDDGGPRIERLSVSYAGIDVPDAEVWILADTQDRRSEALATAALERYVLGWRRMAVVRAAPLAEGLRELWERW